MERAENNKKLQEKYMDIVYKSRNNEDKSSHIGAANAITILNASYYKFSEKDLSNIKIPGADLGGGEFVNTDFTNADLSEVNLSSTILSKAKFIGTKMTNVELLPIIIFDYDISFIDQSFDNELIAVGSGKSLFIYDREL